MAQIGSILGAGKKSDTVMKILKGLAILALMAVSADAFMRKEESFTAQLARTWGWA